MIIKRVWAENFRNINKLDIAVKGGFVVITGPNGAGKTNFLESIYYTLTLKRFPDSALSQLFRFQTDYFKLKLVCESAGEEDGLEAVCRKLGEKYQLQPKRSGQLVSRGKYSGICPVIYFLPQELGLLSRSPGGRRRFLDNILSATSAEYRHNLAQYSRALKQRNELLKNLKSGESAPSDLGLWDERLAEFGAKIILVRKRLFEFIGENFTPALKQLSGELGEVKFSYIKSGDSGKERFLEILRGLREKEERLGTSLTGPHRDDFWAGQNGHNIAGLISRGQMRAVILALKIMERAYIERVLKKPPIMLLDDIFSEFDEAHQEQLLEFLKAFPQVFITTAVFSEIEKFIPKDMQVYNIKEGEILHHTAAK